MPEEERISFAIRGPAVDQEFRLDQFSEIVSSYQQILDRSFLAVMGKRRMRKEERELFTTRIREWKHGSIIIELVVIATPFLQGYMELKASLPHFLTISEVIELTYKFLKARIEQFLKTGRSPHVEIINSPNAQVFLNMDGGKIQVSQNLIDTANMTEHYFRTLTSHIDGKNIKEIDSISTHNRGIKLRLEDNNVFNPATEIDSNGKNITAKIFRFDVESGSGRLRVLDADDIEKDSEIRFEVVGKQSMDAYVDALHSNVKQSKLKVLCEFVRHPSGTTSIAVLHVTEVVGSDILD